jgi:hypothetical protein
MSVNRLKATDAEIYDIFAHLKEIADACEKKGFAFMFTASVYNLNKEYTNEMHANGMSAEESRILLYMHSEEITKNQITNLLNKK